MGHRSRDTVVMTEVTPRTLKLCILFLFVLVFGTFGYRFIEDDYSFLDAFYMTIITITTVGFGEIHDLSDNGRMFTVVLIVLGWGTVAVFAHHFARVIIESELTGLFTKKKMSRRILKMDNHYVVCGFGRIGGSICAELEARDVPFVVLELDEDLVAVAEQKNYCVVRGDATTDACLRQAGVERAAGVVAALAHDKDNLFISLAARELNPRILIISRGEEPGVEDRILRAGADIVVSPMKLGGQQIAELIVRQSSSDSEAVSDAYGPAMLGFSLRIFRHPGDEITTVDQAVKEAGALAAVAIKHEDGSIEANPRGGMEVSPCDSLVMVVQDISMEQEPITRETESKKILLADDHKALRLLFSRKIRAAGHEVFTAEDGIEALRLAEEHTPDLVVLDVTMPGKDGYEVCKELRQMAKFRDVPIIMYSATETDEFFTLGKEAGADLCVRKTSRSSELLGKIERLLEGSGPVAVAPQQANRAESEDGPVATRVFDPARMIELTDGDLALIEELVGVFLEDTPRRVNDLKQALEEGDAETAIREAHSIKGTAGNMGCTELQQLTLEIEKDVRGGDLDGGRAKMPALTEAYARLEAELRATTWEDPDQR